MGQSCYGPKGPTEKLFSKEYFEKQLEKAENNLFVRLMRFESSTIPDITTAISRRFARENSNDAGEFM